MISSIYDGRINIEFDEENHIYKLGEKKIPSVTTILYHDKKWTIPEANLKKAAANGTIVHKWIEEWFNGKEFGYVPPKPEGYLVENAIKSFEWWVQYKKIEPMFTERILFSESDFYCGMGDLIGVIDGELTLIDFKTSLTIYDEYAGQMWAYRKAAKEEGIDIKNTALVCLDKKKGKPGFDKLIGDEGKELWEKQIESFSKKEKKESDTIVL